jgi:hypothetical protein
VWLPVPGFEGLYEVSDQGRVRSVRRRRQLHPSKKTTGYLQVTLAVEGVSHYLSVHRIVAMAFLPNPENKPQVNHKNGNKTDNRVANLEWMTNSENQRHRFEVLGHKGHTARPVICLDTGEVFPSAKAAAERFGCDSTGVTMCCSGTRKSHKNLHFNYWR